MSIESKLTDIRIGKSRKIHGITVKRDSESIYYLDGMEYSLKDAVEHLSSNKPQSAGEIAYSKVAFLMIEPPSRVISTHQVKNRKDHKELIAKAKEKGLYLYYADVKCRDGKHYAVQPWIVDWETVPKHPAEIAKREAQQQEAAKQEKEDAVENDSLVCPYCSKQMSSTSGLTLHVKSKHPEKFDKYQAMERTGPDEDEDVVDRASEAEDTEAENDQSQNQTELQCPFCKKKMTSTPGRTLHVKSKHPDRLEEYLETIRG